MKRLAVRVGKAVWDGKVRARLVSKLLCTACDYAAPGFQDRMVPTVGTNDHRIDTLAILSEQEHL